MNLYSFAKAFLYPEEGTRTVAANAGASYNTTNITNNHTTNINLHFNISFNKPKLIKPITKY